MQDHPDLYDVSLEDFEHRVLEASRTRPVLVDFWAEWCGPCLVIAPVLERVVAGFGGRVALARVEVDEGENMKLAGRYRVRGFPSVILFEQGEERARFASARSESFIREFVLAHARSLEADT